MSIGDAWTRFLALMRSEWRQLTAVKASDRRWQMPFGAALASGVPLMIGAWFGRLDYGLISSLGGLVFVYMPRTPLHHRMVWLMACAFGMTACYALGVMSQFFPPLIALLLAFITILATMVLRYYGVGPPGSLFFIMAAAIAAYTPGDVLEIPRRVGLFAMGGLLAVMIAFFYSIHILRRQAPQPVAALPVATFDNVVVDAVVIGIFVAISLALAQVLQLERPYWVPVSCLAVMQEMSLRAVWNKQLQRIAGTALGLLLSLALLSLPFGHWGVALLVTVLTFAIETLVVRHYGLAVVFITPLTLLLGEASGIGSGPPVAVMLQARFLDTALGCVVGLAGGACIHSPGFRSLFGRQLRRLIPRRLTP